MCPGYQLAGERLRDRRQDQVRLAQRRQVSIPERTVNSQAAITAAASLFASTTDG
jgi:hypothetical protein